jgi:hypothetical protein
MRLLISSVTRLFLYWRYSADEAVKFKREYATVLGSSAVNCRLCLPYTRFYCFDTVSPVSYTKCLYSLWRKRIISFKNLLVFCFVFIYTCMCAGGKLSSVSEFPELPQPRTFPYWVQWLNLLMTVVMPKWSSKPLVSPRHGGIQGHRWVF